jgi:hypothetical protein
MLCHARLKVGVDQLESEMRDGRMMLESTDVSDVAKCETVLTFEDAEIGQGEPAKRVMFNGR